jgi:hypothetical protein
VDAGFAAVAQQLVARLARLHTALPPEQQSVCVCGGGGAVGGASHKRCISQDGVDSSPIGHHAPICSAAVNQYCYWFVFMGIPAGHQLGWLQLA